VRRGRVVLDPVRAGPPGGGGRRGPAAARPHLGRPPGPGDGGAAGHRRPGRTASAASTPCAATATSPTRWWSAPTARVFAEQRRDRARSGAWSAPSWSAPGTWRSRPAPGWSTPRAPVVDGTGAVTGAVDRSGLSRGLGRRDQAPTPGSGSIGAGLAHHLVLAIGSILAATRAAGHRGRDPAARPVGRSGRVGPAAGGVVGRGERRGRGDPPLDGDAPGLGRGDRRPVERGAGQLRAVGRAEPGDRRQDRSAEQPAARDRADRGSHRPAGAQRRARGHPRRRGRPRLRAGRRRDAPPGRERPRDRGRRSAS
jgi:hypothetical protein